MLLVGQMSVRVLHMRLPVLWCSANLTFGRFKGVHLVNRPRRNSADGAGDGELDDAVIVVAEDVSQDRVVVLA